MFIPDPGFDFCPSRIRLFSIPDPNFSITDPGSSSKNLSIFIPKKKVQSSRKYYPGCSPRMPDPDPDFLPIPDPESRGQKSTGSRIRNTAYDGE
jgi:hypothetical protein